MPDGTLGKRIDLTHLKATEIENLIKVSNSAEFARINFIIRKMATLPPDKLQIFAELVRPSPASDGSCGTFGCC